MITLNIILIALAIVGTGYGLFWRGYAKSQRWHAVNAEAAAQWQRGYAERLQVSQGKAWRECSDYRAFLRAYVEHPYSREHVTEARRLLGMEAATPAPVDPPKEEGGEA